MTCWVQCHLTWWQDRISIDKYQKQIISHDSAWSYIAVILKSTWCWSTSWQTFGRWWLGSWLFLSYNSLWRLCSWYCWVSIASQVKPGVSSYRGHYVPTEKSLKIAIDLSINFDPPKMGPIGWYFVKCITIIPPRRGNPDNGAIKTLTISGWWPSIPTIGKHWELIDPSTYEVPHSFPELFQQRTFLRHFGSLKKCVFIFPGETGGAKRACFLVLYRLVSENGNCSRSQGTVRCSNVGDLPLMLIVHESNLLGTCQIIIGKVVGFSHQKESTLELWHDATLDENFDTKAPFVIFKAERIVGFWHSSELQTQ